MSKILPEITSKIELNNSQKSIVSKNSDCLATCCAIGALYWKENQPDLKIEDNIAFWKLFIEKSSTGMRGCSIRRLLANFYRSQTHNIQNLDDFFENNDLEEDNDSFVTLENQSRIILKEFTYESINDMVFPFLLSPPPIQIVIYDKTYTERERSGILHASIVSQINLQERKVVLYDPSNYNDRNQIVEKIYDLDNFLKGWNRSENLVIYVYPSNLKSDYDIDLLKPKLKIQLTLDEYFSKK